MPRYSVVNELKSCGATLAGYPTVLKSRDGLFSLRFNLECLTDYSGEIILRKEVIQPQVPLRLPCYDFTPIKATTLVACPLAVSSAASGHNSFRGVTGGVYKARERIHRSVLICDY
jgi:hypothetical protein